MGPFLWLVVISVFAAWLEKRDVLMLPPLPLSTSYWAEVPGLPVPLL